MSQAAAFAPVVPEAPPLYAHQQKSVEFYGNEPNVFNQSDPGTGKTRAWLHWFREFRNSAGGGPGIVFAPKSILEAAWLRDATNYTPELNVRVVTAKNRADFQKPADLYVTNIDMLRILDKAPALLPKGLRAFNIDESTSIKTPTSQRSKAARRLLRGIEHRTLMSGTPAPQGVLDLWHQMLVLDDGERLGESYWRFRAMTCEPVQVGPHQNHVQWAEKPGAMDAVADLISDIVIRYQLEDVLDMPENVSYFVDFPMTPAHRAAYEELRTQGLLLTKDGGLINPVHAASMRTKLLQVLSGAVYNDAGVAKEFASERYELILDLVEARSASLVAFQYSHQKDHLVAEAQKRGIKHGVIDGSVSMEDRTKIVEQFQDGKLQAVFAHPATAGHGLTLTRGVATIWAGPTDNAEYFKQFNHRIYRAGQKQRTETIKIIARDTVEDRAFDNLERKLSTQDAFLNLVK